MEMDFSKASAFPMRRFFCLVASGEMNWELMNGQRPQRPAAAGPNCSPTTRPWGRSLILTRGFACSLPSSGSTPCMRVTHSEREAPTGACRQRDV